MALRPHENFPSGAGNESDPKRATMTFDTYTADNPHLEPAYHGKSFNLLYDTIKLGACVDDMELVHNSLPTEEFQAVVLALSEICNVEKITFKNMAKTIIDKMTERFPLEPFPKRTSTKKWNFMVFRRDTDALVLMSVQKGCVLQDRDNTYYVWT